VFPAVVAILVPKCPLCLGAWFAAGTGVALPAIVARSIRPASLIVCMLAVIRFLFMYVVRSRHKMIRSR
jgi:hypothetical protein